MTGASVAPRRSEIRWLAAGAMLGAAVVVLGAGVLFVHFLRAGQVDRQTVLAGATLAVSACGLMVSVAVLWRVHALVRERPVELPAVPPPAVRAGSSAPSSREELRQAGPAPGGDGTAARLRHPGQAPIAAIDSPLQQAGWAPARNEEPSQAQARREYEGWRADCDANLGTPLASSTAGMDGAAGLDDAAWPAMSSHPDDGGYDGLTSLSAWPEHLVEVWQSYLEKGDGRFDAKGLRRHLEAVGLSAPVTIDDSLGESVLGVDPGDGQVYLLPHFDSTPNEVAGWFQQGSSTASRLARIQRLVRVAVARRAAGGRLELLRKGAVE
ncbi:MAG TPA: hypothetical protein VHG32_20000 [Thermoanaerobaculia bacterium]|jgi:hypothetical protein|nr:hypothetical protein [Thermoanaerobaculia bacterium]